MIATLLTTAIIIVARFVWVYPATYLPRWLFPAIRRRDPYPSWQQTFAIGFIGVRGVVSLAAALAIPLTVGSGAPFPYRDLILFVTFGVIILTLIGQGLVLPLVIRWLRLGANTKREHEEERKSRTRRAPRRDRGRAKTADPIIGRTQAQRRHVHAAACAP